MAGHRYWFISQEALLQAPKKHRAFDGSIAGSGLVSAVCWWPCNDSLQRSCLWLGFSCYSFRHGDGKYVWKTHSYITYLYGYTICMYLYIYIYIGRYRYIHIYIYIHNVRVYEAKWMIGWNVEMKKMWQGWEKKKDTYLLVVYYSCPPFNSVKTWGDWPGVQPSPSWLEVFKRCPTQVC